MSDNPSAVIKADTVIVNRLLNEQLPLLMWLSSNGETPNTDVRKALDAAALKYEGQLKVLIVDSAANPEIKERFRVGKRPLLIGWHAGEAVSRRQRPWAADVEGIAEKLAQLAPASQETLTEQPETKKEEQPVDNQPVHVTDTTFEKEVLESELPVMIDFWADWCRPCKMIAPTLEKLAKEYAGKVRIAKVDVDHNPGLAQAFRIMSIPTLMFVKEGKIVGQTAGALPEPTLRDALEQLIALELPVEE